MDELEPVHWSYLRTHLRSMNEEDLGEFLINWLSRLEGYRVFTGTSAHGPGEHGVDILASYRDPLGSEFKCYIQTKSGKITTSKWRNEIKGQIGAMEDESIADVPIAKEQAPLRRILAYNGEITNDSLREISSFQANNHPRLELWGIEELLALVGAASDFRQTELRIPIMTNLYDGKLPQFFSLYEPQEMGRQAIEQTFSQDEVREKLVRLFDTSDIEEHVEYEQSRDNILLQLGEWLVLYTITGAVPSSPEFHAADHEPELEQIAFDDLPKGLQENELLARLFKSRSEMEPLKKGIVPQPHLPDGYSISAPEPGTIILEGESSRVRIKIDFSGQRSIQHSPTSGGGWGRSHRFMGCPLTDHETERILSEGVQNWQLVSMRIELAEEPGLTVLPNELDRLYDEWVDSLFHTFERIGWENFVGRKTEGKELEELKGMVSILGRNLEETIEGFDLDKFRTDYDYSFVDDHTSEQDEEDEGDDEEDKNGGE